ncbi:MAG: zinc ABC transporter substrate-binding protein [Clostridia bacterium]|nr:zinc ABC transporter substrate-binding protein [Clostridia bacterium]
MKIKKIILSIVAILIVVAVVFAMVRGSKNRNGASGKLKVVVSNYASYDFLRAIIGDNENIELTFLMGPGKNAHSYDPTAQDLVKIQEADLFVYVGGEMEQWSEKVLDSLERDNQEVICIADFVDTIEEKEVDGAEEEEHHHEEDEEHEHNDEDEEEEEHEHHHEEGAFDEHIWTSPKNAIKMVNTLEEAMEKIDGGNAEKYKKNAEIYINKINEVDQKIRAIVDNKVRYRLIFADKMPMQYFIDYYGLEVTAAFNGCSTETEPSAKTIAYIESVAKKEKIPVILYIELNDGRVAKTIADEIGNGCEAMQIQTLHNVSLDDFNNGETWVSLMNKNLDVLRKALQ